MAASVSCGSLLLPIIIIQALEFRQAAQCVRGNVIER